MGRIFSAFGVAGGIFVGSCNTCAPPQNQLFARGIKISEDISFADDPVGGEGRESFSLMKDDWNGLRVRMTELQVRRALIGIGFHVVPGRNRTMLTFDPARRILHLWKVDQTLPALVFMETRRKERKLRNVWGVQLIFYRNRLLQFSPQYFTNPVELVEPDDEYVTAEDMQRRLKETYGDPSATDEEIDVVYPDARGRIREKVNIWDDGRTNIIFRRRNDAGLVRYALVFSSRDKMKTMEKVLSRLLESAVKRSDPAEIVF